MLIRVLSDETINKIAAGEVVENPACVVKEMVENAIDAKGTEVTIEIKGGGFLLIRISDNGTGMGRDDLILSLERHATSKITCVDDLNEIQSMGFRGEALASIGSISKMRVISCLKDSRLGSQIECNGGKLTNIRDAARNHGTTIEVRSLFFNVPARKKFQKSSGAAQAEIYKTVTKLALANPCCDFKYIVENKLVFHSYKGTLKETCKEVLGTGFLKEMIQIDYEKNGCDISGLIGSPTEARKNRLGQYLFVNKRAVFCPEITHGLYEAYGTRLGSHDHPTFVLHLTIPTHWIDVNIHPQKREIRLQEHRLVQELIREGILLSFQGKSSELQPFPKIEPLNWDTNPLMRIAKTREEPLSILKFEELVEDLPVIGQFDHFLLIDGRMMKLDIPNSSPPYDGVIFVDLKRAHSSLLFHHFLTSDIQELEGLMVPLTVEFAPHECEVLTLHLEEIKKLGVEMRSFGKKCFIVEALSPEIEEKNVKPLLHALLELFDEKIREKEMQKKLALTISRYARSQKKGWTVLEAKHMVKALLKTDSPYLCPKGKPTLVHINYETISAYFKKTH